jgi:hypothetical protein
MLAIVIIYQENEITTFIIACTIAGKDYSISGIDYVVPQPAMQQFELYKCYCQYKCKNGLVHRGLLIFH